MIGDAIGSVVAFFVGGILGRRRTIFLGSIFAIIGACLQGTATALAQLLTGRIISGVGVGIFTSTIGLWQAETTPKDTRGRFMSLQVSIGTFGFFLSFWINYGFHNNSGRVAFMLPLLSQLVFVVITASLVLFMPESPHWLVETNKHDEALLILARLEGNGSNINSPGVQQHYSEIVQASELERTASGGLGGLFLKAQPKIFDEYVLDRLFK